VTAADRLTDGYEPAFDIDYEFGRQGELFVASVVEALAAGDATVEVKRDAKIVHTGNVYIEYRCLRGGAYQPSGIADTKADLWAFVLPANVLIVAPVENVRELARRHYPRRKAECVKGDHPTKGVAIPVGLFVQELYKFEIGRSR
jgi:hypothetical protein